MVGENVNPYVWHPSPAFWSQLPSATIEYFKVSPMPPAPLFRFFVNFVFPYSSAEICDGSLVSGCRFRFHVFCN